MVKQSLLPDRALAIGYGPAAARPALRTLLALDEALGRVSRTTREPMLGRMRYAWWFEALERLDVAPPPAEPILRALAVEVLPSGVTGASLATMIDAWEILSDDEATDDVSLERFAQARGGILFDAMARVCGAGDAQARAAGEGWALIDLASNLSDAEAAARARAMAAGRLEAITGRRWSREGRAIGALALLARFETDGSEGATSRVARLLLHRLTGR